MFGDQKVKENVLWTVIVKHELLTHSLNMQRRKGIFFQYEIDDYFIYFLNKEYRIHYFAPKYMFNFIQNMILNAIPAFWRKKLLASKIMYPSNRMM